MSRNLPGDTDYYTTSSFFKGIENSLLVPYFQFNNLFGFNEGPKISNDMFKNDYKLIYYDSSRVLFRDLSEFDSEYIGYYTLISTVMNESVWKYGLMEWTSLDKKYRQCITYNLFDTHNSEDWCYRFLNKEEKGYSYCYFLRDDLRKLIDFAEFSQLTRDDLDHDDYSDRLVTDQINYLRDKIKVDCNTHELQISREEVQRLINITAGNYYSEMYNIMRYTRCYGDWFGFVFKPNWDKKSDWFNKKIPDKYPTITKLELAADWEHQIDEIIASDMGINRKAEECLRVGNIKEIRKDIKEIIANVDNYLREELKTMVENIANLIKVGNKTRGYFLSNSSALLPVYRTFMISYRYLLDACKQIAECSIDDIYGVRFQENYKCYINRNEPEQTDSRLALWKWINNIVNVPNEITASYIYIGIYCDNGYTYITNVATEKPILYNTSNADTSEINHNYEVILFLNGDKQSSSTFYIGGSYSIYRSSMFFRWLLYNEKQIIGDTIIPSSSIIAMIFGNLFRRIYSEGYPLYDKEYPTSEDTIWFLKDDIDEILGFVKRKSGQVIAYAGQSNLVNIFRVSSESPSSEFPLQLTFPISSLTRFAYPLYNIWRFISDYRALAFNSIFIIRDTSVTPVPVFITTSEYNITVNGNDKIQVVLGLTEFNYSKNPPERVNSIKRKLENSEYAITTPGDSSNILRVQSGRETVEYYKTLVINIPNGPDIPFLQFDFEDISYKYKLPLPYTMQNDERVWINSREEYEQWINQYNSIQIRYLELLIKMVDYCTISLGEYINGSTAIKIYGLECYPKEDIKAFVEYSKKLFENEITLCNDYFSNYFIGKNKLQQFYSELDWENMDNSQKTVAYRHITLGRVIEINEDGVIYSSSMIGNGINDPDTILYNLNLLYREVDSQEYYYITEMGSDLIMIAGDIRNSPDRYEFWMKFKGDGNTMEKYLHQIEPAVFIQDIRYYAMKPDRFKYIYILDFNQNKQLVMSKYDYEEDNPISENYINPDILRILRIDVNNLTKYTIEN